MATRFYRLADTVVLRRERFGGMAFHPRRGTTLELDPEGFEFLLGFRRAQPLPGPRFDAHVLAFELRNLGFLRVTNGGSTNEELSLDVPLWHQMPDVLSAPEVIHLALTARCDLSCPGCYVSPGKDAWDWPALRDLIDQMAEMRVFQLALGGGEPTLHSHLIDVVAYARQRGVVPNLTTHGGRLTPALVAALRETGIGQINVSLNASAPEHNSGRGKRPWEAAVHGLEQLRRSGVTVGVNCLVTAQNLRHLPDTLSYFGEAHVRRVTILGPKTANDPNWLAGHRLEVQDYTTLRDILSQWCNRLNITLDCALVGPLMGHLPEAALRRKAIYGCMAAKRICVIDAQGNVWPCAFQQSSQFCAGNALATPLQDLWLYGEGFQRFHRLQKSNSVPCC